MIGKKSVLAVIPARSGSKRLKDKNILKLKGKPMISWSIDAALKSKYIDSIIVSSDSNKILNISDRYGVHTIKRPDYLANDTSTTFNTVKHAIENIKESYDFVILLQPTSPLRTQKHIDKAFELLKKHDADAIISVTEMSHSPFWANRLPKNGSLVGFLDKKFINMRSQDLPVFHCLNGAIYICSIDRLLEEKTFFIKDNIFAYEMDKKSSVDIDDKVDFKIAEILLDEEN